MKIKQLHSGVSQPDHLVRLVKIKIVSLKGSSPIKAMFESIENLKTTYNFIEKKLKNLYGSKDGLKEKKKK
jgi:hypothetical protein